MLSAHHALCVVFGEPGGGKTSLLRTHAAGLLARRRNGRAAPVPVLVPAAALAEGPLHQSLSSHATSELGAHGLLDELTPAFFAAEPRPGVPWMVLVDGVDEITDSSTRHRVLRTLRKLARSEEPTPYRFLLASRPLPEGELDLLGKGTPCYELQPFDVADLRDFARIWFETQHLPGADEVAEAFIRALDSTGMAELARVPLMATMLCRLHAAHPGRPLPASRGRLYREFVGLLYERQHAAGLTGIIPQTRAALERYGGTAAARAQQVLDGWPGLMEQLAAARFALDEGPTLDLLAALPGTEPPPGLPAATWREFLEASVRRSGLLTLRAGDYEFLHQTLLEYLAACAVPPARIWNVGAEGLAVPAVDQLSYFGFLFDDGGECPREGIRLLTFLAGQYGLQGARYLAGLASLGTRMPDSVLDRAARTLDSLARDGGRDAEERSEAVTSLSRFGGPFGSRISGDLLDGLAGDATVSPRVRREAAHALARKGDARGAVRLTSLAREAALDGEERVEAARWLSDTAYAAAGDLLAEIAHDSAIDTPSRERAADDLAWRRDGRGAALLRESALDGDRNMAQRQDAASGLARLDAEGVRLLHDFAHDAALLPLDRVSAVCHVVDLYDDAGAFALLLALVRDTTLGAGSREYLVHLLAAVSERDPDAAPADATLDALARDPALDPYVRTQAAAELAFDGHRRGSGHLHGFVQDPGLPGAVRAQAAYLLAHAEDPGASDALAAVAGDPGVDGILRVQAAGHLDARGNPGGVRLLRTLRDDRELSADARARAAEELGPRGTPES